MNCKRASQTTHDSMVKTLIDYISKNNFTEIKADLKDFTTPSKISWKDKGDSHIPDVTGKHAGVIHLFEVETDDSINVEHTKSQWKLFGAFANQNGAIFIPVVPAGSKQNALLVLNELGLKTVDVWEI